MAFRSRGLPSTGCNRCRARKIRCDETKPTCDRCQKIGYHECEYRDEFERTWRSQNGTSVSKSDNREKNAGKMVRASYNAVAVMNAHPGTEIFSRLFYDWSIVRGHNPGTSITWFNALPKMYAEAPSGSLLSFSITALASVSYGRRFNNPGILKEGVNSCGEALGLLRSAMSSSSGQLLSREMLISVILLGIYESLVDPYVSSNGSWMSHMSGAAMLFNLRCHKESDRLPIDLETSATIVRQMLHGSLMSGRAPTITRDFTKKLLPGGPKHVDSLMSLVYETTFLCAELRMIFRNFEDIPDFRRLKKVTDHGRSVHERLLDWTHTLPAAYTYSSISITTNPPSESIRLLLHGEWVPQHVHRYPSPISQMLWRFNWIARLILCQGLLYAIAVLEKQPNDASSLLVTPIGLELSLIASIDRLCESCMAPWVVTNSSKPANHLNEDIPSLQGYLLLQIAPVLDLCLNQVVLHVDLDPRRQWVHKMKYFLRHHFGFAKAAAVVDSRHLGKGAIQLWDLKTEVG